MRLRELAHEIVREGFEADEAFDGGEFSAAWHTFDHYAEAVRKMYAKLKAGA